MSNFADLEPFLRFRPIRNILSQRLRACGLELHPIKTRIVFCKSVTARYANRSFDFLGYTFRLRGCKSRKGKIFTGFTPAISKTSLKLARYKIRKLNIRKRTDLNIEQIAKYCNPILRGWLNYFGVYNKSSLEPIWAYMNNQLLKWAMKKFKKARSKIKAWKLLVKILKNKPKLFVHWSLNDGRRFT